METDVVTVEPTAMPPEIAGGFLTVDDVIRQAEMVQQLQARALVEGKHYGTVPGTDKPTLLQPGAEKICVLFRLRPDYEWEMNELNDGHREYDFKCELFHIETGLKFGEGHGYCTTLESKYRWRGGYTVLDEPIPEDYRQNKRHYKARGLGAKKIDEQWRWVRFEGKDENPDIADTYNTVKKMARKRALVDAVKSCTAVSDVFTQDLEDRRQKSGNGGNQASYGDATGAGDRSPSRTASASTGAQSTSAGTAGDLFSQIVAKVNGGSVPADRIKSVMDEARSAKANGDPMELRRILNNIEKPLDAEYDVQQPEPPQDIEQPEPPEPADTFDF